MIKDLDNAATELAAASEDIESHCGLQEAKNWLEAISTVATETSQATVDRMRGSIVDATR